MSTRPASPSKSRSAEASEPGETIRVVSKRTGLSMEVLRAWERRFGFPKPERRPGSNRRLYSQADVARLLAIRAALDRGYRIGDVVAKTLAELEALGSTPDRGGPGAPPPPVPHAGTWRADAQRLVGLLLREDVPRLEAELRHAAATLGPRRFVTELAQPFASAVGAAWAEGELSIRHEHVATECLATRLRQQLDGYQDVQTKPVVLLATLPGEWHTLPLQMVALYLAVGAAKPRLLGGPTPVAEIVEAAVKLEADVVGLTVSPASDRAEARRAIRTLARSLPSRGELWVGGGGAPALDLDVDTARVLTSWSSLDEALAAWRRAPRRA